MACQNCPDPIRLDRLSAKIARRLMQGLPIDDLLEEIQSNELSEESESDEESDEEPKEKP